MLVRAGALPGAAALRPTSAPAAPHQFRPARLMPSATIRSPRSFSGIRVGRTKFILFLPDRPDVAASPRCCSPRASARPGRRSRRVGSSKSSPWWCSAASASSAAPAPFPASCIAAFIMGLVTFGFGLLNVPGIVMSIFIGLLLILVIALPIVWRRLFGVAPDG